MKFSYSHLPGIKNKVILAPVVPVVFHYLENELATFALVDSGATGAVMSTVIADELGIKWRSLTPKNWVYFKW